VTPDAVSLIAITDTPANLIERARAAVRGGATMIQLRLKDADARTLTEVGRALVAALDVPVVINDRADVALACGAAGAHLGADDVPLSALRRVVPPGFILGASAGNDAELDAAGGADYVGIGAVYATGSKADAGAAIGVAEFARLAARARDRGIPAVAVGGITAATAGTLRSAGAAGVAVISAIFGARDPETAARAFTQVSSSA
jgi:thiamine-phosphate pyrophosphorylase